MPIAAEHPTSAQPPSAAAHTVTHDARFGLAYLEREFAIHQSQASAQIAFGETDHGIDGFHFDPLRRNLYLFIFKCSDSYREFKRPLQQIIKTGLDRVFKPSSTEPEQDQLLTQVRSSLAENEGMIERVCIHLIFNGDPRKAEPSQVLDRLREALETKKHVIDQYFSRSATLLIELRSARTRTAAATTQLRSTPSFAIRLNGSIAQKGPTGENMVVGFLSLKDLHSIYQQMGVRFFERNIRSALPGCGIVSSSLRRTLADIVVSSRQDASTFAFNHNGVTLSAESITGEDGNLIITEPRLLNGVQTVISVDSFLREFPSGAIPEDRYEHLSRTYVLARLITEATPKFITMVTINNNRQNPVHPWNLHANDMIQLELQDKFRDDLGVFYERQQNAFAMLTPAELQRQGITQFKSIEMLRLARTFLISDGQLDKLIRFGQIFEDDRLYARTFDQMYLNGDSRQIVLCYKVQFRLSRLLKEIYSKAPAKSPFVLGARTLLWALLCQAILNDPDLESLANDFGRMLGIETRFNEWLSNTAVVKCRPLLVSLVTEKPYAVKASAGNFNFLRTTACFKRVMESAHRRWGWNQKRLR